MNDPELAGTVKAALAHIVDYAPAPAPWPVRDEPHTRGTQLRRWMVPAAATVIGVAGAAAVIVVGGQSTDAPGKVAPETTPVPPRLPGVAVTGEPTCGGELPVNVSVPGSSGMQVGAATAPTPAEGQYVVHWEAQWGTVEVRWPADERLLYDLEQRFTEADMAPRYVGISMASDGSWLDATLDTYSVVDGEPVTSAAQPTPLLHLERAGGEGDAAAPCDVVQVRYLGDDWRVIEGYFWPDFARMPSGVVDLNPLIVATEVTSSPPTPDNVTPCDPDRGVRGGTLLGYEVRATPAEALAAYLSSGDAASYVQSGYHEFVADGEDRYVYTYSPDYDPAMVATLVTVERDGDGWTVTGLYHSGC
jgi:hypothetical protein